MKKFLTFVLLAAFIIPLNAQTKQAQISSDQPEHNLGKVKEEGGTVTHKFEFVNTGGSPLIIHNVRATCGCTAPDWTRNPIPPGGKGFVAATFNPAGRPAAFTKFLYVDSNSEVTNTKLTITGEVIPKPRTIEDDYRYVMGGLRLKANHMAIGNISNTETKSYEVEVINNTDKPMKLGFQQVPAHLQVAFKPEVLKPHEKGIIVASYDASKKSDWGMLIDRVNVTIDGVSDRTYRLIVSANIIEDFSAMTPEQLANAPAISVDETEVDFGKMKQNDKFEHDFVIKNTGKSTLYIRKIKASCGCTAVKPEKGQIEPGESVKIKTVFNSAGKRGNQNKTITVITNDPNRTSLILRLKGEVLV